MPARRAVAPFSRATTIRKGHLRIGAQQMKQVAQRARDGEIGVIDVPLPALRPGWVLVATRASLISAGTAVAIAQASLCIADACAEPCVKMNVNRASALVSQSLGVFPDYESTSPKPM